MVGERRVRRAARVADLAAAAVLVVLSMWRPIWAQDAPAPTRPTGGAPATTPAEGALVIQWQGLTDRRWAGPEVWTNRLQDWAVRKGRLVCQAPVGQPCRTAHILTRQIEDGQGAFAIETLVHLPPSPDAAGAEAGGEGRRRWPGEPAADDQLRHHPFVGFLVGAGQGRLDYRAAAMIHDRPGKGGGLLAVYETDAGVLSFRDMRTPEDIAAYPRLEGQRTFSRLRVAPGRGPVRVRLEGRQEADADGRTCRLSLSLRDARGRALAEQQLAGVPSAALRGNLALAANGGAAGVAFAFDRVELSGPRLSRYPERAFGPIAGTLYSVSNRTLKLGVQFMHLGEAMVEVDPGKELRPRLRGTLQVRPADDGGRGQGGWQSAGPPQAVSPPDYYVLFRVADWDVSRNWWARVSFQDSDGRKSHYDTFIRRDPADKPVLTVAGFTGMGVMGRTAYAWAAPPKEGEVLVGRWTPANVWMPFADAVSAVQKQGVDLLFFTGDQVYESKPSPKIWERQPTDDYLYKWLLWHWSFNGLTRQYPSIVQTDDHDVYHGNVWGWSGRLNLTGVNADGGYLCSPHFVNLVQRTQAGADPDAADPGPALNNIGTYFTSFTWGGVGFAVLEDRKFKTPRQVVDPARQEQLGRRQLAFLRRWGEDWAGQQVKVVVSQTVYASMHVNAQGKLVRDYDSNGFPKVGRDRSVEMFRRCGAFVLAGDQHLGTFVRLGVQRPDDAVYQFCVPAMGNIFWRWFYPVEPGADRAEGRPAHLGVFRDRFGNYFRMIAVANPERQALLKQGLRQRHVIPSGEARSGLGDQVRTSQGDGYGILRIDKAHRSIRVECWPHNADPAAGGKPFAGWPITVGFDELDGRQPVAYLPDLRIEGRPDAVVQIRNEATGEVVKIARAHKGFFRPGVFDAAAKYTLRVGDPAAGMAWWTSDPMAPQIKPGTRRLRVPAPQDTAVPRPPGGG